MTAKEHRERMKKARLDIEPYELHISQLKKQIADMESTQRVLVERNNNLQFALMERDGKISCLQRDLKFLKKSLRELIHGQEVSIIMPPTKVPPVWITIAESPS